MDVSQPTEGTLNIQEQVPPQEMLVALLRVFLGCVFIIASIDKIADPNAFAVSISNYKIVFGTPTIFLATILPWIEILSGAGLVLGLFLRGSALLTLSMLVVFTILVVLAMVRGLDISCGCFTQDPSAGKIGWRKIGENAILVVVNIIILRISSGRLTLERFVRLH